MSQYTERRAVERTPLLNEALRRELIDGGALRPKKMSFDDDVRDAPFSRPARIRVSGPDGEKLPPIEIGPATLTVDHTARISAARQIARFETSQAEQIAARLESTDPILAGEIRKALARRFARPQQQH
ncbi:MAG TPA: hypothetical protein VK745_25570, partial [Polyangiaceae bacterium]|nr:hypothetical protein [Polyangiaceae bacterium]